jgi:opacity protein-like surface antigen
MGALIRLPKIRIDQMSRLADYRVNVALPDSLYESDRVVVDRAPPAAVVDNDASQMDTTAVAADSAAFDGLSVPLSDEEESAYASIDSTQTLEKAFEPKGLVGRLVDLAGENEEDGGGGSVSMSVGGGGSSEADSTSGGGFSPNLGLRPRVWFNRVEGLHVGGRPLLPLGDRVELYGLGGYATSVVNERDRWTYGGGARINASNRIDLEARYRYGIDAFGRSALYAGRIGPSIYALTGEANYLNFVGAEELRGTITYGVKNRDIDIVAGVRETEYRPVAQSTRYDLFARQNFVRQNPAVSRQLVRSADLSIRWEDGFIPLSVLAQRKAELQIEHSNAGLGSDVTFTRVRGDVYMRIPTFLQRRLLPMALDLRLLGQTHTGTLPVPRFGAVDAALLPYTPFGALRTRDGQPYLGEHAAAVHWEHSFRTSPFELLGLMGIARRGWNVILHGGHARTWIDDDRLLALIDAGAFVEGSNGWHHELGVSVSGIGGLIRIDGTARLDEPAFSLGVSLPRLF